MRTRLILLFLEFLAITLPLTWLWDVWGRDVYLDFFESVAGPALELLGVRRVPRMMVGNRFLNLLPFFALMVITPGLRIRRRLVGSAVGFGLIFLVQIGFAAMAFHARARYGLSADAFSALFPMLLLSDSFPFLIWAVVAHEFVRDIGRRAVRRVAPRRRDPSRSSDSSHSSG
ncbi:MAG: hypothetical protein V3T64_10545 [Myxococcota bacterium]